MAARSAAMHVFGPWTVMAERVEATSRQDLAHQAPRQHVAVGVAFRNVSDFAPDERLPDGPRLYATSTLPTDRGELTVRVFRFGPGEQEALAISRGALAGPEPVFARVHSECWTGEVLGSLRCDCRDQLEQALAEVIRRGRGVVVYLRQEGRGIGLGNKIRAYALQDEGVDTVTANHRLGFDADLRDFAVAAQILRGLGVHSVLLHTNNPDKLQALLAGGLQVVDRVAAHGGVNPHNRPYLETKHRQLGHDLGELLGSRSVAPRRAG
jgi:GTP cyclohydrolase II